MGWGWILCLDTSAPRTCVALGRVHEDGRAELVVEDEREDRANQTSERLHLRLQAALDQAEIDARALAFVACGCGPGTFTGSRVAVATVKGLCLGLGVPALPLSTLACLAASHAGREPVRVLALLDARRAQVYGGLFELGEGGVEARSPERVIELAALIAELREGQAERLEGALPIGPGCGPYAEQLPPELRERATLTPGPTARGLWRAALGAHARGEAVEGAALQVRYLRESYAEMGINTPKRPVYKTPYWP